jgi:hypothetical protein
MHTHRVERSSVMSTAADCAGNVSSYSHDVQAERHWCGPWVVQPDRARP